MGGGEKKYIIKVREIRAYDVKLKFTKKAFGQ